MLWFDAQNPKSLSFHSSITRYQHGAKEAQKLGSNVATFAMHLVLTLRPPSQQLSCTGNCGASQIILVVCVQMCN